MWTTFILVFFVIPALKATLKFIFRLYSIQLIIYFIPVKMAAQEARYGSDYDRQVAEDNCDPPTKITSNLHLIYTKKVFF